jgi:hypothetical protein
MMLAAVAGGTDACFLSEGAGNGGMEPTNNSVDFVYSVEEFVRSGMNLDASALYALLTSGALLRIL